MSLNETQATVTPEQFLQSLSVPLSPEDLSSLRQNLESLWLTIQVGHRLKSPHDSLLPSQFRWASPPERIGDFRIVREIGRGGMGIVFEAVQESLERRVAIKILPAHSMLDSKQLQRFKLESRASAKLHHSNIVPVFGVGEFEGLHYYVMQYIRGLGLDQILVEIKRLRGTKKTYNDLSIFAEAQSDRLSAITHKLFGDETRNNTTTPNAVEQLGQSEASDANRSSNFRLPEEPSAGSISSSLPSYWRSVAKIGLQVAQALSYAHSQGVLHRDIKPSNLLLDEVGNVWIADFGLAKSSDDGQLTQSGDIVGTLAYLAPERLQGKSDARSDVYGLGISLYELAALKLPFEAQNREALLRRVMDQRPAPPHEYAPEIPRDLETIILKAIATKPEDRYQTAEDLAADLERFIADRPIRARRPTWIELSWRWCRRNPTIATLSGLLATLICVLTVTAYVANWIRFERDQALENFKRATQAESEATQSKVHAEQAQRQVRWSSLLSQAGLTRRNGGFGQRTRSLAEIDKALVDRQEMPQTLIQALANEVAADLALTDLSPGKRWPISDSSQVQIDAQFRLLAIAQENKIELRDLEMDQIVQTITIPEESRIDFMLFSPDGHYLAVAVASSELYVWSLVESRLVAQHQFNWSRAFDFSPDSSRLIVAHGQQLLVLSLQNGQPIAQNSLSQAVTNLRIDPDGQRCVMFSNRSRKVEVVSIDGAPLNSFTLPNAPTDCVWSPDGHQIALGCLDGAIHLWSNDSPLPQTALRSGQERGLSLAYSPNGKYLASNDWSNNFRLWDVGSVKLLLSDTAVVWPLSFSADSRQLGILRSEGTAATLDVVDSKVYSMLPRKNSNASVLGADFHPSGKWFALATSKGLEFWNSSGQRQLATLAGVNVSKAKFINAEKMLFREASSSRLKQIDIRYENQRWILSSPSDVVQVADRDIHDFWSDPENQTLVTANLDGAQRIDLTKQQAKIDLKPHADCRFVDVAKGGQLIATGSHFGSNVLIWNDRGELLKRLAIDGRSSVSFSPNGKLFATTGGGCRLWDTTTWQELLYVGGSLPCFSKDSSLAVNQSVHSIQVHDASKLARVALLESPFGENLGVLQLSPDSNQLLEVNAGAMWNLFTLRQELQKRNLDWPLPALRESALTEASSSSGDVVIELLTPDASTQWATNLLERARTLWQGNPDLPNYQNNLAWALCIVPPSERNPELARKLAQQAVDSQPENSMFLNTLGVALYRCGEFEKAVEILGRDVTVADDEGMTLDIYFLAMSHFQQGQVQRAKMMLNIANRWSERLRIDGNLPESILLELRTIQQEAELLIQ